MKRAFAAAIIGLVAATMPAGARADVIDEAWKHGNEAYFKGDFVAAAAAFEQLDRQGVVAVDLYYNLGVAQFRLGNLGRAIWSFERVLTLDSDDEDARFNLAQAHKLAERRARDKIDGAERDATWIRVVGYLAASTQTWLFVILYSGCFFVLFLRRRLPSDSRAALNASAAILGFSAVLAGLLLVGRVALDRIPFGVILPDAVAVKEGADPNYRTSFELHAGLRVRLLERDQDWVRLRLANGLEGWVRTSDVGRL